MKSVIICLMTIIYIANAWSLDKLVELVNESKRNAENDLQHLKDFHGSSRWNAISDTNIQRNQQTQLFDDFSDQTIDEIRKKVEAAKAEGKNAQPCYDATFDALKSLKNTVTINSEQCANHAEDSIEKGLVVIKNNVMLGEGLIQQFDAIVRNCYDGTSATETCIITMLGHINGAVKKWQSEVETAKTAVNSALKRIVEDNSDCLLNIFSPAIWKIFEINMAAIKCLEAL